MDENVPLSWIEQTLIEAWAGSSAPPAPPSSADGTDPWYACYTTADSSTSALKSQPSWQKCVISDESDVRYGCAYYYHEASQTTQWERPNGYESPAETEFGMADDEARRQARFLSGELDEQSEAAAAVARCIELLAVRGDDAAALALTIKGCGVGPERLLKAQRGKPSLLAEAAVRGAATCVALLIDGFGADVNDTDNLDADNSSPLHLACWNGQASVVEALLARGANLETLNKWRETPAEAARARGFEHCANIVEAALTEARGGKVNEGVDVDQLLQQEEERGTTWQQYGEVDVESTRSTNFSPEEKNYARVLAEAQTEACKVKVVVLRGGPLPQGTICALDVDTTSSDCSVGPGSVESVKGKCACSTTQQASCASVHGPEAKFYVQTTKLASAKGNEEATSISDEICAVPVLRIGRAHDGNDLVLSELAVSKKHAQIAWLPEAHSFALRDAGSKHGLKVRGIWYSPPAAGIAPASDKKDVAVDKCESADVAPKKYFNTENTGPWLSLACGDEFEIGSTVLCLQAVEKEEVEVEVRASSTHSSSETNTGEIVSTFKPSAKLIAAEASCNLRLRRAEKEKQVQQQQEARSRAKLPRQMLEISGTSASSSASVDLNPAPRQRRRGVTWAKDVIGGEASVAEGSNSQRIEAADVVVPGTTAAVAAGVGGAMLQQMGWQSGQGLGKHENGVSAPVEVTQRLPFSGLGTAQRPAASIMPAGATHHGQARDDHRAYKTVEAWERMRARFDATEEKWYS